MPVPLCFSAMLWTGLFEAGDRMWWTGWEGRCVCGEKDEC